MKKLIIIPGCFIGVFALASLTLASDSHNWCGAFSRIGLGARALGMGGAFVPVADDATSIYWNPAGLAFADRRTVAAMYAQLYELPIETGFVAYTQPDAGFGAAGIGWTNITITGLETEQQNRRRWSENTLTYAYARKVLQCASLGIATKWLLVRTDIEDGDANGFALDAAAMIHPLEGIRLGLLVANLYSNVKWGTTTRDRLPVLAELGIAFCQEKSLILALDLTGGEESLVSRLAVGGEFWVLRDIFALRAGVSRVFAANERYIFSAGTGLRYRNGQVDYAYLLDDRALGDTHRFSVSLQF